MDNTAKAKHDHNNLFCDSPTVIFVSHRKQDHQQGIERANFTSVVNEMLLAALHAKARAGETGIASITEQGITEYVCYAPVAETNGWSILVTADRDDFMESTRAMIITTIAMILAGQVIVSIIAIRLGRGIGRPISASAKRLTELAAVTAKDETAQLADSTKQPVDEINVIIGDMDRILSEMANRNFNVSLDENRSAYVGDFAGL